MTYETGETVGSAWCRGTRYAGEVLGRCWGGAGEEGAREQGSKGTSPQHLLETTHDTSWADSDVVHNDPCVGRHGGAHLRTRMDHGTHDCQAAACGVHVVHHSVCTHVTEIIVRPTLRVIPINEQQVTAGTVASKTVRAAAWA